MYKNKLPFFIAIILFLQITIVSSIFAASSNKRFQAGVYGHTEHFKWEEFDDNGDKLLKETGPLFGIGGLFEVHLKRWGKQSHFPVWSKSLIIEGKGEIFLGDVDYNGALWDGTPYKSTTSYTGIKSECDIAFQFLLAKNFYLKPLGGVGIHGWLRELDNEGDRNHGYDEQWVTIFLIGGIEGTIIINHQARVEAFGKLAVRMPAYNKETIDMSNLGGPSDIKLEPGGTWEKPSIYFETGMKIKMFHISLSYEQLKFSKSEINYDYGIYQPKSEAAILGLKAGIVF